MNRHPRCLIVDDVLQIHHRMIAEFGGSAEVRDQGLLQSAVSMPRSQFAGKYLHDSLPAMAAAYLHHLCCNHPFVDGNKRTEMASAAMFILINDDRLDATNDELERLTLAVATGTMPKSEVTEFMQNHIR